MTADERINRLLSRFGQTISNLPKPDERKRHYTYSLGTKYNLDKAAKKWDKSDNSFSWDVVGDYACHLCDVIDRMEIALETAVKCAPCHTCANIKYCDGSSCDDFRIEDEHLSDVSEKDLNEEVYGGRK